MDYEFITYLLNSFNIGCEESFIDLVFEEKNHYDYYDVLLVKFTNNERTNFELIGYGAQIKMFTCSDKNLIKDKYLIEPEYKCSPFILIRLPNQKFGYIDIMSDEIKEFESQDEIKNKLLDFLLSANSP